MRKKRMFRDVKGTEPADYFLDHFRKKYPAPPVNLEGGLLHDIWINMTSIEQRFIHHLERAYSTWRVISKQWVQEKIIVAGDMTELQLWVVDEDPEFDIFLANLDTRFANKETILSGINKIHSFIGEPFYINAFESACYFFLLARHCLTPAQDYPYYNAMLKAHESYGQFRGWAEIVYRESKLQAHKGNSALGGNKAARNSGSSAIREELVRILKSRIEDNARPCNNKNELAKIVAPELFHFIEQNKEAISPRSQVESIEELACRIHDWSKRDVVPYKEIYTLFGRLIAHRK